MCIRIFCVPCAGIIFCLTRFASVPRHGPEQGEQRLCLSPEHSMTSVHARTCQHRIDLLSSPAALGISVRRGGGGFRLLACVTLRFGKAFGLGAPPPPRHPPAPLRPP